TIPKVLVVAKNKLKLKKTPISLVLDGTAIHSIESFWNSVKDGSLVVVSNDVQVDQPGTSMAATAPAEVCTFSVIENQGNHILHLKYHTANHLQQALKRPHLRYEKSELKGPLKGINFPIESLIEWAQEICVSVYADSASAVVHDLHVLDITNDSPSTPTTDVSFNYRTLFNPLELHALEICLGQSWTFTPETRKLKHNTKIQYLIAHTTSDRSTFVHEWAHAVFHLRLPYRTLCESVFCEQTSEAFRMHIARELVQLWNYHEGVVVDEFQAYVVEGPVAVFGKKWVNECKALQAVLRAGLGEIPPY
ncbi:UNVERIFIED_CONTAM: hypothetical protein HDU68_000180, partial [Siphonaria sp. JEL0065]